MNTHAFDDLLNFTDGQTVPTAEQVERYIWNANQELAHKRLDPASVWCADALRAAIASSE